MRMLYATALMISGVVATPALAQSAEEEFQGFYVGGTIGMTMESPDSGETILFDRDLNGTFGDTITTSTGANAFSTGFCAGSVNGPNRPTNGCSSDRQTVEFSARMGFDQQFGNVVAGFVLEGGRTEARSDVTAFSTTPASYTLSREIDFMIDLRARAGFTVTPMTLVYGTAGGSYARLDQDYFSTNTANSAVIRGGRDTHGFVVGGGVEQKLGRTVSLGLEYLYRKFDDEEFRVRLGRGTAAATSPFVLGNSQGTDFRRSGDSFDLHSVRAVLHFRFR